MTITNSSFEGNIAAVVGTIPAEGDEGGAIYNYGHDSLMMIIDCYFYDNDAYYGGAINNKDGGDMVIVGSELEKNGHVQSGGAISNKGGGSVVNISESLIGENKASHGGGIYNVDHGRVYIADTTIYSNAQSGLSNYKYAKAVISRTTFVNNRSFDFGGGIENYVGAEMEVTNSTFSANSSSRFGGAIYLTGASQGTGTNITIYGNSARNAGGGVYVVEYSLLNLYSSIIAGSVLGGDCFDLTYAPVNDLGYNIIEDGSCVLDSTSSGGDPLLSPLQDNGGKTDTHALVAGSPALDAIPKELCAATEDQRGTKRPSGSGCDIGAFELISSYEIFLPLVVIE
jgi:predicted outer membrane repeat protein